MLATIRFRSRWSRAHNGSHFSAKPEDTVGNGLTPTVPSLRRQPAEPHQPTTVTGMTTCLRHVCHVFVWVSPLGHKTKILTRALISSFFA